MLKQLSTAHNPARKAIEALQETLKFGHVYQPKEAAQFVFLCGANQKAGVPSARRQALLKFAKAKLPDSQFFLAEPFFDELQKFGSTTNILDLEHEITAFADTIIIILESFSAFCELGAFSHSALREKLIVINDKRFEKSNSFICNGPLKALDERGKGNRVLYYPMAEDGVYQVDAIGQIFNDLHALLQKSSPNRSKRAISLSDCHPKKNNKDSLRFLHDLVYLAGPLEHSEVIFLLQILFEKGPTGSFDQVKHQLSLLVACGIIESKNISRGTKNSRIFSSKQTELYYQYLGLHLNSVISAFKVLYMRYDKRRLA